MTSVGMRKVLSVSYDEAMFRVPDALNAEGFGVLTEVDVQSTLRKKLDVDFRRYAILGACNPPFAHQALQADLEAGLMMPCNVIVYEGDDRRTVVAAIDPTKAAAMTGNPKLIELAGSLKDRLERALARLE